jgi:hypothetical protein
MESNEQQDLIPEKFVDRTPEGDGKFQDVEFSEELADEADRIAQRRAEEADERAEGLS